jgi:hypothetical protein
MHAVQTTADPPNQGRIIFAIIGSTWNNRNAPRKMAIPEMVLSVTGEAAGDSTGGDRSTDPDEGI